MGGLPQQHLKLDLGLGAGRRGGRKRSHRESRSELLREKVPAKSEAWKRTLEEGPEQSYPGPGSSLPHQDEPHPLLPNAESVPILSLSEKQTI